MALSFHILFKKPYTTADVCQVLGIHPDTFRYRLRHGRYPEPVKVGGMRKFTEEQIRDILKIATDIRNAAID
jgi:predicted site-specific integrase-resolvase